MSGWKTVPRRDHRYARSYRAVGSEAGVAGSEADDVQLWGSATVGTSWLKVPALVTHGGDDPTVPISASIRLKGLQPSLVTFERFPGAGHVESWNIDRARYTSLLESFLSPVAP